MDFATADRLSATRGADFIADLLPKHPIYIELLPEAARAVIGKPHRNSLPAMMLLKSEGFRYEGYVDVFDVGPQMHCDRDHIATVARSRRGGVSTLSPNAAPAASSYLVCTEDLANFRVIMASALASDGDIALGNDAARVLGIDRGMGLRWSPGAMGETA